MDRILLWLGQNFTSDLFHLSTVIQEAFWSTAELLIVFFCLKIANFVRIKNGKRRIIMRYILFWGIVIVNPVMIYTMPGHAHDRLMLINFSIMIYTAISERRDIILTLNEIINS
jgi:hypothetical protein